MGRYSVRHSPPYGTDTQVLALPRISLIWTDKLIEIRRAILERRAAIANIHGEQEFVVEGERIKLPPTKEEEDPPVMKELKAYRKEVAFVESVLTDPDKTSVVAVMNPEMLPLYETERAYESLKKFRIPFNMIVMNKVFELKGGKVPELKAKLEAQERVLREVSEKFKGVDIVKIPIFPEEPPRRGEAQRTWRGGDNR